MSSFSHGQEDSALGVKSLSTQALVPASDQSVSAFKLAVRPTAFWNLGQPRTDSNSLPLPRREAALVHLTALHMVFLPWALGTVHPWSEFVSLGLSIAGFIIALWPESTIAGSPVKQPVARLIRWPFFWAGIAMLAYIAVQGSNPTWRFVSGAHSWILVPVQHVDWLPTGVAAPFSRSNPWRELLVFGSLWFLVCSVRIGFLRRRSLHILFALLVANAGLLGILGMAEQLSEATKIFWSYLPSNAQFVASFIYRNHAGAYFDLMVTLATGLAWWHFRKYKRLQESPAQTVLFAFLAAFVALMVVFSASRMATFLLVVFAVVSAGLFFAQFFRGEGVQGRDIAPVAFALVCCVAVGLIAIRADAVWGRYADLANDPHASMEDRMIAREAAGKMLRDHWFFGWGAGCFRYGFPIYAQHYPAIYEFPDGLRKYWEHAHDDLLEIPIDLGAAGLLPIAVAFGMGTPFLWRRRFWRNPLSFCLILGCALTVAHAWLDFVFQCPAVLLTWSVLVVGATRWLELDSFAARRRINPQTASTRVRGPASPA
jgi:O-antigen ligase